MNEMSEPNEPQPSKVGKGWEGMHPHRFEFSPRNPLGDSDYGKQPMTDSSKPDDALPYAMGDLIADTCFPASGNGELQIIAQGIKILRERGRRVPPSAEYPGQIGDAWIFSGELTDAEREATRAAIQYLANREQRGW